MDRHISRSGLEGKFFEGLSSIVTSLGYKLYDLRYLSGQSIVRLFIYKDDQLAADIEDCVKVDRGTTDFFEAHDWIPDDVTLEVSSPGLYRDIRCAEQFELHLDQRVSTTITGNLDEEQKKCCSKRDHNQKKFIGLVKEVSENHLSLDIGKDFVLPLRWEQLKKANCEPDFNKLKKTAKKEY